MLSAERFAKLSERYEKEQAALRQSVEGSRDVAAAAEAQTINIKNLYQ